MSGWLLMWLCNVLQQPTKDSLNRRILVKNISLTICSLAFKCSFNNYVPLKQIKGSPFLIFFIYFSYVPRKEMCVSPRRIPFKDCAIKEDLQYLYIWAIQVRVEAKNVICDLSFLWWDRFSLSPLFVCYKTSSRIKCEVLSFCSICYLIKGLCNFFFHQSLSARCNNYTSGWFYLLRFVGHIFVCMATLEAYFKK